MDGNSNRQFGHSRVGARAASECLREGNALVVKTVSQYCEVGLACECGCVAEEAVEPEEACREEDDDDD